MSRPYLVHAIAYCRDCDYKEEYYKIAIRKGGEHACKTSHCVDVDFTGYRPSTIFKSIEGKGS